MLRMKETTSKKEAQEIIKSMRKKGFRLAMEFLKDNKIVLVFQSKNGSSKK